MNNKISYKNNVNIRKSCNGLAGRRVGPQRRCYICGFIHVGVIVGILVLVVVAKHFSYEVLFHNDQNSAKVGTTDFD